MTVTVRDATFDVFREYGLTSLFANPGSTEITLLADLPADLRFVLGLHESSVVGMATGYALGRGKPALAILHTTAGLGNAVGALATARVNRAPLVVVVGQQDRRHLANDPFLTGRLTALAGDYPVSVEQPVRAQDVPGAVSRAAHEAVTGRGPALVIVPMDDWAEPAADEPEAAAADVVRAAGPDPAVVEQLADFVADAAAPAIVVVSDDPAEVHRSPAELAVLGPLVPTCRELARVVPARDAQPPPPFARPAAPAPSEPLRAAHVLAALAARLPSDAVVVEEAP